MNDGNADDYCFDYDDDGFLDKDCHTTDFSCSTPALDGYDNDIMLTKNILDRFEMERTISEIINDPNNKKNGHINIMKTKNISSHNNHHGQNKLIETLASLTVAISSLHGSSLHDHNNDGPVDTLKNNDDDLYISQDVSGDYKIVPGMDLRRKYSQCFPIHEIDKRATPLSSIVEKKIPSQNHIFNMNLLPTATSSSSSPSASLKQSSISNSSSSSSSSSSARNTLTTGAVSSFRTDLTKECFTRIEHLTDGSNSNIFKGYCPLNTFDRSSSISSNKMSMNTASAAAAADLSTSKSSTSNTLTTASTSSSPNSNSSSSNNNTNSTNNSSIGNNQTTAAATTTVAVVLKVILDSPDINPLALKEFEREVLIMSRLSHPHIVSLYGSGFVKSKMNASFQRPMIVLEALNGGTLSYHLNMKRPFHSVPFSTSRYLRMAKEFADALYYLHDKLHSDCMLIHRDLKPDNIGFTANGTLKIMDFGLCIPIKKNSVNNAVYQMTGFTGSLRYMAPEVALYLPYNEKVDIYSYGLILYQIITGDTPFLGYSKNKFYETVVQKNLRPAWDYDNYGREVKMKDNVREFITKCWDPIAMKRPSAKQAYELFSMLVLEKESKIANQGVIWNSIKTLVKKKDTI